MVYESADREPSAAYDRAFAALAHPTRRQILITLHFGGGAMGAGAIARMFEHAWPTISRHLQVMEDAGLITHERHGRARTYRMNRKRLELLTDWLGLMQAHDSHPSELQEQDRDDP